MSQEREVPGLGVPELDLEHAVQVRLVEAFLMAVSQGPGAPPAGPILLQLLDYTEAHFLAEQLLMRLHAYPGYEGHLAEHEHLVATLRSLKTRLQDDPAEARAVAAGLRDWLLGHIQSHDRALATYLKNRPPRVQPG
jgi:hemerythrin